MHDFLAWYISVALFLRVGSYVVIAIFFLMWGAHRLLTGMRLEAAIQLLTGLSFIVSIHLSLLREPTVSLLFATPSAVVLALMCLFYVTRWQLRLGGYGRA